MSAGIQSNHAYDTLADSISTTDYVFLYNYNHFLAHMIICAISIPAALVLFPL